MKTDAKTDFKALEALRKACDNAMISSRVSIGYDLYSYIEAVLKERVEAELEKLSKEDRQMEELYVVIGTDAFDSWVCLDAGKSSVFHNKEDAEKLKSYFHKASELYGEYTYKVAKLTFLD